MMAHSEDYFLGLPETVTVFARAGGGNSMTVGSTNKGAISVSLLPGDERERTLDEINREARQVLSAIPGQKVMFGECRAPLHGPWRWCSKAICRWPTSIGTRTV